MTIVASIVASILELEQERPQCCSSSSIDIHCSSRMHRKIIVNFSSAAAAASSELLTWSITVAARPGDEVIVMHLLHADDGKEHHHRHRHHHRRSTKSRILDLLEQCKELCHFRQVTTELKLLPLASQGVESTLLEQASILGASMLVSPSSLDGLKRAQVPLDVPSSPPDGCTAYLVSGNALDGACSSRPPPRLSDQCHCSSSSKQDVDELSPRGVLQGPTPDSDSVSPPSSSSSSGSSASKPLLRESSHVHHHHSIIDEDEDDELQAAASCLNLFRTRGGGGGGVSARAMAVVKRQSTFPELFACGSSSFNLRLPEEEEDAPINLCIPESKPSWKCFTYEELQAATDAFHQDNLVGKGGYAEVYKGRLPDGQFIAVKKLTKGETEQQKEGGFLTELGIIGHVSHPNATSLIGFCVDRGLHLVFPYSSNGSLSSVLHGTTKNKPMEWSLRYKVAIGAARGLHYLHKLCPRRIIHRDIKASNILLGADFEAKISDFGLAKWLPEQWTHHTVTPIEGTFGYLAPEYFMHGIVDEKTDVFAYGVLLLELISGRKPIDSMQRNIVVWAKPHLESCNIQELVDPSIAGAFDMDQMRRLVLTATLCIRQSPLWRPCMNQVLKLLTDEEIPNNWSKLVCMEDEYTSNEYNTDLSRHRALAFET